MAAVSEVGILTKELPATAVMTMLQWDNYLFFIFLLLVLCSKN